MKINKLSSLYIKTKIVEHSYNKKKLLSLINKGNFSSFDNIHRTDWHFDKNTKREYLDLFYKIITPYMDKMCLTMKAKTWRIHNGWFQQYKKNNCHEWHRHAEANFANVYYLELPETASKTQIIVPWDQKTVIEIDVKEGDILSFPSFVIHKGPKNLSSEKKTIVSYNTNLTFSDNLYNTYLEDS